MAHCHVNISNYIQFYTKCCAPSGSVSILLPLHAWRRLARHKDGVDTTIARDIHVAPEHLHGEIHHEITRDILADPKFDPENLKRGYMEDFFLDEHSQLEKRIAIGVFLYI